VSPAPPQAPSWVLPLLDRRLLVLCGAGGVGKTTTAASLAVEAAVRGRRVLVMTIDPARRLADSLGLAELGNEERAVDLTAALPGEEVRGTLHAMMLDTRAALEELIDRLLPDPAERERVRGNKLFRVMLEQMVGVQEYLSGEKLYDVARTGRYDLVVLDTPPSRNALDFLDAPERFAWLMDERIMRWFLPEPPDGGERPGLLRRLLSSSGNVVKRILGRVFGRQLMDEVEGFFGAIAGMRHEIRKRSVEVVALMQSDETAFLLVTGTSDLGLRDALYFHEQIAERRLPFAGFVVNRVHAPLEQPEDLAEGRSALRAEALEVLRPLALDGIPAEQLELVLAALQENGEHMNRLAQRDLARIRELLLRAECPLPPLVVPLMAEEVHDLSALRRVAAHLLSPPIAP